MWHLLKTHNFPRITSLEPLSTQNQFSLKPYQFQAYFLRFYLKGMFSKTFFLFFVIDYAENYLRFLKLGIFRKWVGVLIFSEKFSKFLIGLSPICCLCIYAGPLWQFKHVLRHISLCSCIFHHLWTLLHDRCLSKCPSDILVLNWTQVSSNDRFLSCIIMLTMFWSLSLCFTHFAHVAHTLGTQ